MAGPADDYHRGEMDVHEQASTYSAFLALSKWGSLIIGTAVLFLTLLCCTETGWIGSIAAAAVLGGLGFLALRSKPQGAGH